MFPRESCVNLLLVFVRSPLLVHGLLHTQSVVSVRVRQEMTSVPTFDKYETNVQLIFVHQGVHHNLFSSRSQNGVSSFPQYTELHDEHFWIGIVRLYANQDPAHAFPHSLVRSCVVRTLVLLLVYLRSLLDSCLLDFSLDCWIQFVFSLDSSAVFCYLLLAACSVSEVTFQD